MLSRPLTLSSYFLEGIEVVPVDIVVDGNRGRAIELDFDQSVFSFKRRTTGSESTRLDQLVNGRTFAPGRSAPARLTARTSKFARQPARC